MKKPFQKLIPLSTMVTCLALIVTSFLSCKKEESKSTPVQKDISDNGDLKLRQFLSITTNTEIKEIRYDSETKEFVVKNIYRILKKDLMERYEVANEYKLNFEK